MSHQCSDDEAFNVPYSGASGWSFVYSEIRSTQFILASNSEAYLTATFKNARTDSEYLSRCDESSECATARQHKVDSRGSLLPTPERGTLMAVCPAHHFYEQH